MFEPDTINDIRDHAVREYPKESCGFVVKGEYIPLENISETPEQSFKIADELYAKYEDDLDAIIHSHPDGPDHPSERDMVNQAATAVPWGIVTVANGTAQLPFFWGDGVEVPPLIGREFRHGVTDCYSYIRDYYRVERGVTIPDYPRGYDWWYEGKDLYSENFRNAGFTPVDEPEVGDVGLAKIHAPVINHGMIYLGNGLIGHHLVGRLSRREPVFRWQRFVRVWLRYTKE